MSADAFLVHGETDDTDTTAGPTRRSVVLGAAWSVPVIAAAIATPLAAASTATPADLARVAAIVGGAISADAVGGTATGQFLTSGLSILDVTGEFSSGELSASYTLTGPWNTGVITKPDGTAFSVGETISHGGTVWTVSAVDEDADGVWRVAFTGLAVTVTTDTVVSIPPAIYSGTFTPGVPNDCNRVGGTVSVAAAEIAGGTQISNASTFP